MATRTTTTTEACARAYVAEDEVKNTTKKELLLRWRVLSFSFRPAAVQRRRRTNASTLIFILNARSEYRDRHFPTAALTTSRSSSRCSPGDGGGERKRRHGRRRGEKASERGKRATTNDGWWALSPPPPPSPAAVAAVAAAALHSSAERKMRGCLSLPSTLADFLHQEEEPQRLKCTHTHSAFDT